MVFLALAIPLLFRLPNPAASSWLGIPVSDWFWLSISIPIVHQSYVWLCWRLELRNQRISNKWGFERGFLIYLIAFFLLFGGRFLSLLLLAIAERHSDVTVLFADIVGFTPWASVCKADQVVEVLDQIFSAFDLLCEEHDVEKIKTIGDAYMAAGGVPHGGGQVEQVVRLALSMMNVIAEIPIQGETALQLRIGLNQGPVVAGVIGRKKFIYDLWGDTVNLAARMESHGVPGRVQVTENIATQLGEEFLVEPRGIIEVKGKGSINAYLVSFAE